MEMDQLVYRTDLHFEMRGLLGFIHNLSD
jgi:hypothetical protein